MAWLIEKLQRPALVIAHNKTLAAQLCNEFREFFPANAVEYFVSYYDYYQPEAYVPQADLYIEKDSSRNDDIDRLRHAATASLLSRRDTVIVASVSCIYGLGSPEEYEKRLVNLAVGEEHDRDELLRKLIDTQYVRNDTLLGRGRFRVKGDVIEVQPASAETAYRISLFGDEVEQITHFDPLTGEVYAKLDNLTIFPATQYVTSKPTIEAAMGGLRGELDAQVRQFEAEGKLLEAHRIRQRTEYDMEMMKELGFCNGIENYSRVLEGRPAGSPPHTLLDYFPSDFLCFIDESHQTVPQIGGMYEGDRSRKQTLVDFGFRLPSALDNRPLRFDEFLQRVGQTIFVSATPGAYELRNSAVVSEQLIRPTGIVDPEVELRATKNQIDDLLGEIRRRSDVGERVLVTTLTKKMSEDLTDYLLEAGVKARYLHSEIDTLERIQIIRELRLGEYDVLVGVNLLREGLDLPEVSLVAVLDADKEGFLRGKTALVQTIGRAARNVNGRVLLYGDKVTEAIQFAVDETEPPPRDAARLQRGARDHAREHHQGRLRHRRVPLARVADRAGPPAAWEGEGRGPRSGRDGEARDHARGGDVRGGRGAPLRVRREAARRDQGAAAGARRRSPELEATALRRDRPSTTRRSGSPDHTRARGFDGHGARVRPNLALCRRSRDGVCRRSRGRRRSRRTARASVGLVADTSAVVAIERGGDLERTLADLGGEPLVVPAIVYAELLAGVSLTRDPVRAAERRAKVATVAAAFPIVEFGRVFAERWAEHRRCASARWDADPFERCPGRCNGSRTGVRRSGWPGRRSAFPAGAGAQRARAVSLTDLTFVCRCDILDVCRR